MARRGSSIMELLLAACILSVSLVPLFYLFNITKKTANYSEKEFLACLLAQHVMEEVVAFCSNHPESLPPITNEEPIVTSQESPETVSSYFNEVLGKPDGLNENEFPSLFWSLKPFRCQVDTYLLENHLYKVIVYIFYEENDQKKKVFLERLLARNTPTAPVNREGSHE